MINTLKGRIRDSVLANLRHKIDDMDLSGTEEESKEEGTSKLLMGLNILKKKLDIAQKNRSAGFEGFTRKEETDLQKKNKSMKIEINEFLKPKLDYTQTIMSGTLKYEMPRGPAESWDGTMVQRSMVGDEQTRLEGRIAKKIRQLEQQ